MGYSTDFEGSFTATPSFTPEQIGILQLWADQRHEPYGAFPSYWCMWVSTVDEHYEPDGKGLEVSTDGDNKWYEYLDWLRYVIEHFIKPWGVSLSGEVRYEGDELGDSGTIFIKDNVVEDVEDVIIRGRPSWEGGVK